MPKYRVVLKGALGLAETMEFEAPNAMSVGGRAAATRINALSCAPSTVEGYMHDWSDVVSIQELVTIQITTKKWIDVEIK